MAWFGLLALGQATVTPLYFPPFYERIAAPCASLNRSLPRFSDLRRDWYSKHLAAAGEPSLFQKARTGRSDVLRFTWLRTFDAPVIVRIDRLRGRAPHLSAVQLSGQGGYAPGNVSRKIRRLLTPIEAADLRRRLVVQNPLALPLGSDDCESGLDGSQWIIERAVANRYKLIDRWSPEHGEVRATGMAMLRLTGWKFKDIY